jgi:hypothetical protein
MTITQSTPSTALSCRLEFMKPFASVATTGFTLEPAGDQAVTVTWSMDRNNNFTGKVFSIFVNMDKMIGGEYEKGLVNLDLVARAAAKRQADVDAAAPRRT